ncbi:MAG: addiction module protein [Verrucomicrobia bacterium]|nr:addiction module protein [Verrucomicrobiota bacterium]
MERLVMVSFYIMTISIQIERMSRAEKLQAMEAIWADLSKDDAVLESPAWHHSELKRTEARMAAGQEQIRDWTDAKQELRKRFE